MIVCHPAKQPHSEGTMGTKKRPAAGKKKLTLNKQTLKDLTPEAGKIKGGRAADTGAACSDPCPVTKLLCRPPAIP